MPYMKNLDYRDVTNARVSSRLKQVLVLIGTILIGMIISITVNAAWTAVLLFNPRPSWKLFFKRKIKTNFLG
jgi:hypothetical protein